MEPTVRIEQSEAMPPKKKMKPLGASETLPECPAPAGASAETPPSAVPGPSNTLTGGAFGDRQEHDGVDVAPQGDNRDSHEVAIHEDTT